MIRNQTIPIRYIAFTVVIAVSLSACTADVLFSRWVPATATSSALPVTETSLPVDEEPISLSTQVMVSVTETPEPLAPNTATVEILPSDTVMPDPAISPVQSGTTTNALISTRTFTPTLTVTNTPTPPFAYLQIKKPGADSFVVSPINIEAMINPGDDGLLRVDLLGENGRIVAHQELDYNYAVGNRFWTSPKLYYSIDSVAELGRLELSVYDAHSRIIALSTVNLYLQSMGRYEINDPVNLHEHFVIRYPYNNLVIDGGIVYVNGLARPFNDNPIIFELIDETRNVIGSWEQVIPQPEGNLSHTPFTVQIPYIVYSTTPVRLTIRQESASTIPGNLAITSMQLILEP